MRPRLAKSRAEQCKAGGLWNVRSGSAGVYTPCKAGRTANDIRPEDLSVRILGKIRKGQPGRSDVKGKSAAIWVAAAVTDAFKGEREVPHAIHHQAACGLRVTPRDREVKLRGR